MARIHGAPGAARVALVAVFLSSAGCSAGPANTLAPTSVTATPTPPSSAGGALPGKVVTLAAAGDSGVFGTATFSDAGGGQTQVVIQVEANYNRDMPGAVTGGTCTAIDESTRYHINDTRDGSSTSLIPVSLSELVARRLIVHIHTAPDEPSLAACGTIE